MKYPLVSRLLVAPSRAHPAQNWILNPLQDGLFIIGAPLFLLALALVLFRMRGAAEATSFIIVLHVVMTVAHHMPTFIRIYGDVDLFRRFKWSFVLGPVIPFTFAMGVLTYLNHRGLALENFFYVFIMLALWDPWHFLMQHYGFMRIYDRHNAAPKALAARMDMLLCATWFVFILVASGDWVPAMLEDLHSRVHLPLLLAIPFGALPALADLLRDLALLATAAYVVYLIWCRRQGHFISPAKLALFAVTFGTMYLTYTPNAWIRGVEPGWTFKVGFATLGIVHMTQYLAIVWRYNRGLAARPGRARPGLFGGLHARGGWLIGGGYVLFCLTYGEVLTTVHENRWLMALLLATGFTSTLMHYYFDGFIWKLRHRQNREGLGAFDADAVAPAGGGGSWWNTLRNATPATVFLRQSLYFGLPLSLLTVGALTVWNAPPQANYVEHMYRAHLFNQQGLIDNARNEAELALGAMDAQLPYARKIAELQPTAAREAALAYLIYDQSQYTHQVLPALTGAASDGARLAAHHARVELAIRTLESALARGGPLGHTGRESMTAEDARRTLARWRGTLVESRRKNGPLIGRYIEGRRE